MVPLGVPGVEVPSMEPAAPLTGSVGPVVPVPIVGFVVEPVVPVIVLPLRPPRVRLDVRFCGVVEGDVVGSVGEVVV